MHRHVTTKTHWSGVIVKHTLCSHKCMFVPWQVLTTSYLGKPEPTTTINFSRNAAQVAASYYNVGSLSANQLFSCFSFTITCVLLACSAAFKWYFMTCTTSACVVQFIRLGRMGYTLILRSLMTTAKRLSTSLEKTGGSCLHVS